LPTSIISVIWHHITDLVSAKGKTKEVYCCDIVVVIVLFWCFLCVKDYNVVSVYWNIVWWGCETLSISWLLFSPLPKLGQLSGCDVSWPRECHMMLKRISISLIEMILYCTSKGRFPLPVNSARELGPWTQVVETDLNLLPTWIMSVGVARAFETVCLFVCLSAA